MEKGLAVEELSEEGVEQRSGPPLPVLTTCHMHHQRAGRRQWAVGAGECSPLADQVTQPSWKSLYFTVLFFFFNIRHSNS